MKGSESQPTTTLKGLWWVVERLQGSFVLPFLPRVRCHFSPRTLEFSKVANIVGFQTLGSVHAQWTRSSPENLCEARRIFRRGVVAIVSGSSICLSPFDLPSCVPLLSQHYPASSLAWKLCPPLVKISHARGPMGEADLMRASRSLPDGDPCLTCLTFQSFRLQRSVRSVFQCSHHPPRDEHCSRRPDQA